MSPDDYIVIDQTYPTRGVILFTTYSKDRPAKYGLNFRTLDSSRRPCIYYIVPYSEKPVEVTESHIKDMLTLVKRIVEGYEQHGYSRKGTNISMDRYYMSIPLAEWLYRKNITCIGTLNSNWKGLSKEIKETKGREENSWISCKSDKGEVTLNLHVMKTKSSGMRKVLLLQTTNSAHYVTQDDKKPLSYRIYDYTKGGIDIPGQRIGSYTTKYKTRNWTLLALSYVLDMARINSHAIYVINNAKKIVDSFKFGWELMKAFVKPNMHTRLARGGLSKHLQNWITHILGNENDKVEHLPPKNDTPRRCKISVISSHGKGHKSTVDSMGKVKSWCAKCKQPVCRKHTITVSESCT